MEINNNSIYSCLKEIGMEFHLRGYDYIVKALELISIDKTYLRALTTRLYPVIAVNFETTRRTVEKSMRYAIEDTMLNMDREDVIRIFGKRANKMKSLPSSEFLAALCAYIEHS